MLTKREGNYLHFFTPSAHNCLSLMCALRVHTHTPFWLIDGSHFVATKFCSMLMTGEILASPLVPHTMCEKDQPTEQHKCVKNGKQDRKRFLVFLVEVEKQQQSHCLIPSESLLVCAVSPDLSAMCIKNNILSFLPNLISKDDCIFENFNVLMLRFYSYPSFFPLCPHCCSTQVNPSIQKGGIIHNR